MDCRWTPADSVPAVCAVCGTVYKGPGDKPPRRNCKPGGVLEHVPRVPGPGDHLHRSILDRFGIAPEHGCECDDWIRKMNAWGVSGCREHRTQIVDWMIEQAKNRHWKRDNQPLIVNVATRVAAACVPGSVCYARRECGKLVDLAIDLTESSTTPACQ